MGPISFQSLRTNTLALLKCGLICPVLSLFHKGFTLQREADDQVVTKAFLITKKGYDNEVDLSGVGSPNKEKTPNLDAGPTEDAKVKEDTKKVFDFFAILKKSNTYIDKVLVNSSNGESLPLSSVEMTITLPEHKGQVAEYIYQSSLPYHKNEDGTYTFTKGGQSRTADGKTMQVGQDSEQVFVNGKNDLVTPESGTYEVIAGNYYDGKKFVAAQDGTVKGKEVYLDLERVKLEKKVQESYRDGDQSVSPDGQVKRYQGSLDPGDDYRLREKLYPKKGDYYISTDGKADILSAKSFTKIVQTIGDREKSSMGIPFSIWSASLALA